MPEYITKEQAWYIIIFAARTGNSIESLRLLEEAPAADVEPVVRCKDCKYRSMESGEFYGLEQVCRFWTDVDAIYPVFVDMNGFCSEGKRKDGGESK